MKKLIKKICALSLAISLLFAFSAFVSAYDGVPETIRIGLYYGSSAKASCAVTSTGGMAISVANESEEWPICEDDGAGAVNVKRDEEYHLKINESFSDYESALQKKESLSAEGYPAFVAYNGGEFAVWVGVYASKIEAENNMGGLDAGVLSPNANSVLVYTGNTVWMAVSDRTSYLTLSPVDGNLAVEGTAYRGKVQFMRRDTGDMTVVNVVDFDDYLCGVVPREVSASWNYEAVKAQAVVSRTFAIQNLNKYKKYGFNLDNTTNSQAYAGIKIEHPASNRAVEETHGEVVLYNGKPADVYFFSSSGGKTGTANDAWGGENKPYLVSVDDPYENPKEATRANWTMTFTPDEIKAKLAAKDINIGDITDIKVEYSDSGRAIRTTFVGTKGEKEYLRENIRWILGVYSTAFTVSRSGQEISGEVCVLDGYNTFTKINLSPQINILSADGVKSLEVTSLVMASSKTTKVLEAQTAATGDFIFTGRGWGHGVGMSQWGAKGMADNGFTYDEIIEYYYQGTEVG